MGLLVVPPPDYIDVPPASLAQSLEIESLIYAKVNLDKKRGAPLNSHAEKRTLYFSIPEKGNFVLQPVVTLFPQRRIGYHIIDRDRCLLLHSERDIANLGQGLNLGSLSQPKAMTPWVITWSFPRSVSPQTRRLLKYRLQKGLLQNGVPVLLPRHRFYCHVSLPKGFSSTAKITRGHRVAKLKVVAWDKPSQQGKLGLSSLSNAFGHVNGSEFSLKFKLDPGFSPGVLDWFQKRSFFLNVERVTVQKRHGRWVYLNVGREYGLKIGTHLVGRRGEKLHVIHFATRATYVESAVALIRRESRLFPIKKGDVMQLDKTPYPVQSK